MLVVVAGGTVFSGVESAVEAAGEVSWRSVLALKLAAALDVEPNAAMARELRSLMAVIEVGTVAKDTTPDVVDDLKAKRLRRLADADVREPAAGGDVGG